ncbi:MAG: hypothetical protein R2873_25210 [Caldilineaceae bacterium]
MLAQRFGAVTPFLRWFTRRCDDVAAISSYTRRTVRLTGAQHARSPTALRCRQRTKHGPRSQGRSSRWGG